MIRERMPDRRRQWTQKVHIVDDHAGRHTAYAAFGLYADGRLGEVFLDIQRTGTFARGVLDSLARMVSLALQCGAPVAEVVHALRGLEFPPAGAVEGSASVKRCTSLPDWLASEIEAAYLPRPAKVAGRISTEGENL